jgi:hypothetical protein
MHLGRQDRWHPVLGPDMKKRLPGGSFVKNVFQKSQNKKNYTFHLQTTFFGLLSLGPKGGRNLYLQKRPNIPTRQSAE